MHEALTATEDFLVGAVIFFAGLIGLIVNVKLISKLKSRSNPNESVNKLYVNLVFCDIGIIVLAFPFPAIASLLRKWIWGDLGCSYYGSVAMFFGMHMMITAFMICIDLFLEGNIKGYVGNLKNKARNLMLAFIWFNATFWSAAPFFGWSSYGKEPTGLSCTIVHKNSESFEYASIIISSAIVCYVVPSIVMLACYFLNSGTEAEMSAKEKEIAKNKTKTVYLIMVLFIIEWAPYTAYYLWPIFDPDNVPIRLNAVAPLAAKLAVVLTPWALMNTLDDKSKTK